MRIPDGARTESRRPWTIALTVLVVLALVAAACGGGDDTTTTDASTSSSEGAAPDESTTSSEADATTTTADAGMAADPSMDPVKIGLIVQDEELFAFPEIRSVAHAMVGYFNAEQGGIDGHPVELEVCGTGDAPESAAACAQQMANADDVHLVVVGTLNTTTTNEILSGAGKPVLTLNNDVPDMLTPGVYAVDPGALGMGLSVFVHLAENVQATSMSFFYADDPFFESFIPVVEALAGASGITINENIPVGFEADLTGPASAGNKDSDVWFFAMADGGHCATVADAVRTVGYEGVTMGMDVCLGEDAVQSGSLDGWYGPSVTDLVATDGPDSEEFARIVATYGDDQATPFGLGGFAAGNLDAARQVLIAAGGADATDASVLEALSTFSSESVIGYPPVSCPGPGSFTGACDTSPLVVQVVDGELRKVGDFLDLDYSIFEALLGG